MHDEKRRAVGGEGYDRDAVRVFTMARVDGREIRNMYRKLSLIEACLVAGAEAVTALPPWPSDTDKR